MVDTVTVPLVSTIDLMLLASAVSAVSAPVTFAPVSLIAKPPTILFNPAFADVNVAMETVTTPVLTSILLM